MPTSNTPMTAAEFRLITDEMEMIAFKLLVGGANSEDEIALDHILSTYRAARAASPRTLEEDILTDIGRGFIKSDEIERQNRYPNDDEQAEMEKVLVRFEEYARRLAGEGGGK